MSGFVWTEPKTLREEGRALGLKSERYLSHLTQFVSGFGVVSGVLAEGWGLYCESAEIGKCVPLHPLLVFVCESLLPLYAP